MLAMLKYVRAKPLVSEVEIACEVEKIKTLGFIRIPIELIEAGVETLCSGIPGLVNFIWN
jgi:hypothetical protein